MIEAQGQFGLGDWNELLFRIIPMGRLFSCAQTEQQRLIRQGDGRAPVESERAEIRDRSDAPAGQFGTESPFASQFNQFGITSG